MRRALAILCTLSASAATAAAPLLPMVGTSIAKPKADWGEIAVAIIELRPSATAAPGYYCVGEPENDPNSICRGAAMFYQRGRVRRVITATPGFQPHDARFKTIGGHAWRRTGGGRYLALLEQTEAGYAWVPWKEAAEDGRFCLSQPLEKTFSISLPTPFIATMDADRCSTEWLRYR